MPSYNKAENLDVGTGVTRSNGIWQSTGDKSLSVISASAAFAIFRSGLSSACDIIPITNFIFAFDGVKDDVCIKYQYTQKAEAFLTALSRHANMVNIQVVLYTGG